MNYRHVYMLIIEHAKSEMENGLRPKSSYYRKNFPGQYFEFHHILPKSIYPLWAKRSSNLVALTAREHFFCHQLLTKIYSCKSMSFALYQMVSCLEQNRRYKPTTMEYQRIREQYDLYNRLPKNMSEEARKKNSISTVERNLKFWSDEENRRKTSENMKIAWVKRREKLIAAGKIKPKTKKPSHEEIKKSKLPKPTFFEIHGFERGSEEHKMWIKKQQSEASKKHWAELKEDKEAYDAFCKGRSTYKKGYWDTHPEKKKEMSERSKEIRHRCGGRKQSMEERINRRKHMNEWIEYNEKNGVNISYEDFYKIIRAEKARIRRAKMLKHK